METININLFAGWIGFLGGAISGAGLGLFFHQEQWLGGYSSFPRRMARLGHISFFGLGLINVLFTFSVTAGDLSSTYIQLASLSLISGIITMPLCCFLTAWRKSFRHLFPIPVISVLIGIGAFLIGWSVR